MNQECTWTDDVCITTSRFWSLEPWEQKAMSRYLKQKKFRLTRVGRVEASGCIPVSARDSKEKSLFVSCWCCSVRSPFITFFSKREMELLFLPSLWLITSTFADSQYTVTETNFRYERTELAFSSQAVLWRTLEQMFAYG